MIVCVCEHYQNEEAVVILVDTEKHRKLGGDAEVYANLLETVTTIESPYGTHGLQSQQPPQPVELPQVVHKLVDLRQCF